MPENTYCLKQQPLVLGPSCCASAKHPGLHASCTFCALTCALPHSPPLSPHLAGRTRTPACWFSARRIQSGPRKCRWDTLQGWPMRSRCAVCQPTPPGQAESGEGVVEANLNTSSCGMQQGWPLRSRCAVFASTPRRQQQGRGTARWRGGDEGEFTTEAGGVCSRGSHATLHVLYMCAHPHHLGNSRAGRGRWR